MTGNSRRLFGLFLLAVVAGLVGGYLSAADSDVRRHLDYYCKPDAVCGGLEQNNATQCGTNGTCRGDVQPGTFPVCKSLTNARCTDDAASYGSRTCPGVCVGTVNQTCDVVAVGCR